MDSDQPQVLAAGALGRKRGEFSLNQPAGFDQFVDVRFRTAGDRPQQRPGEKSRAFADVCAVAEARLDHSHDFERLQRFPQRGATDSRLLA
jgi:hypothetical protein